MRWKLGLYVQVCINSKVKLYPLGLSIEEVYWDTINQRIKRIPGSNNHTQFSLVLEKRVRNGIGVTYIESCKTMY